MNIQINGQIESIQTTTIDELIDDLDLEKKSLVVEHNGTLIKQEKWNETQLHDGDVLELLNFVGGG